MCFIRVAKFTTAMRCGLHFEIVSQNSTKIWFYKSFFTRCHFSVVDKNRKQVHLLSYKHICLQNILSLLIFTTSLLQLLTWLASLLWKRWLRVTVCFSIYRSSAGSWTFTQFVVTEAKQRAFWREMILKSSSRLYYKLKRRTTK